ncbi:nuclear transport factor 2 family protein [Membranicola marinus]|uniref:Nuclear transport factor 2 family protein n=1 Tax=Membranihabitans marinus TaxID=1227546 RepID=A0A953HXF0_9BACT|nr:nuclear transport factor 2 family protein [Membranihabitans marinus]MBY5957512.1 nuclear transport factor 2 family protein [Membranihabitans marinus]
MKRLFLLLLVLQLTIPAWNQTDNTSDEDDAIMAVIKKETLSFFMGEYEDWKDCWAQTDDIYFEWVRSNVHHFYTDWSKLDRTLRPIITENVSNNDAYYAERTDVKIMRDGDMAWVTYRQDLSGDKSNEQRVLEKIDGAWKIIMVTVVASETFPKMESQ